MASVPIWVSSVSEKLPWKIHGAASMARAATTHTSEDPMRSESFIAASSVARSHEAARPYDQHQHHHEVGQHRRDLRDLVAEEAPLERHGERLDEADEQRGDERAAQ